MKEKKLVEFKLTLDEIDIVFRCLNEICHGVRIPETEFETRIGAEKKDVVKLLHKFTNK